MEYFKKLFCRLCLNSSAENFKEMNTVPRDVLKIIPLKLNPIDEKHLICDDCSIKLHAAFEFKSKCISIDTGVTSWVDLGNDLPNHSCEVNIERYSSVSEDRKMCRLCLQSAEDYTAVHEFNTDIFQRYIPEVNFRVTEDPVICKLCLDSLIAHNCFIKNCLHVDDNIEDLLKEKDLYIKSEDNEQEESKEFVSLEIEEIERKLVGVENVQEFIESEEIERSLVRLEDIQEFIKTEEIDVMSEGGIKDGSLDSVDGKLLCSFKGHSIEYEHTSTTKWYECDVCSYKSKTVGDFNRHCLVHKDPSKIKWYACDICSYKSKYKADLKTHSLKHKDPSEVKWYECDVCSYKTKYNADLKTHSIKHKDPFSVRWYECEVCDYKSNWKHVVKNHMLSHRSPSEIRWFQCDTCSYKSKTVGDLNRHCVVHKDPSKIKWYACDTCSYKSKRKFNLKKHSKVHMDPTGIK